jgi:hypothetical protein
MRKIAVSWHNQPVFVIGIPYNKYESETAFQIYCSTWLRKQASLAPEDRSWTRWHHSANERIGARAGLIARLMGQDKGFPDFVHLELQTAIELKLPAFGSRAIGKLSPEQALWRQYCILIGWQHAVVYNVTQFQKFVINCRKLRGFGRLQ